MKSDRKWYASMNYGGSDNVLYLMFITNIFKKVIESSMQAAAKRV